MSTLVVPIVCFVGKSGTGKTTFIEKLVRELKGRGYRVATIKHDVHGFEMDRPGKDTWRFAQAGSDAVMIASGERLALIQGLSRERSLGELAALLVEPVDIVLTEGFKRSPEAKVEVSRKECSPKLLCTLEDNLLAVVSDQGFPLSVPHFNLDDAAGVADLLVTHFALGAKEARPKPLA